MAAGEAGMMQAILQQMELAMKELQTQNEARTLDMKQMKARLDSHDQKFRTLRLGRLCSDMINEVNPYLQQCPNLRREYKAITSVDLGSVCQLYHYVSLLSVEGHSPSRLYELFIPLVETLSQVDPYTRRLEITHPGKEKLLGTDELEIFERARHQLDQLREGDRKRLERQGNDIGRGKGKSNAQKQFGREGR